MMTPLEAIGYVGYVVGAVVILFSKTKNDNIKDLSERVKILESERTYAQENHIENQKAIAHLEGQLKTYKEIPLKSIALSLEALPLLVVSNEKILTALKKNKNQHIDTQTVENQVVGK